MYILKTWTERVFSSFVIKFACFVVVVLLVFGFILCFLSPHIYRTILLVLYAEVNTELAENKKKSSSKRQQKLKIAAG